jgi:hypothetical protein
MDGVPFMNANAESIRVFRGNVRGTSKAALRSLMTALLVCLAAAGAFAQSNVTTQHNDISRTGANANETILTPANVNTNSFGKLFSYTVDGWIYAQPLYMPGVTMGTGTPQAGTTHNVVFVATEHDSVYAFDADNNTGANANPLWHVSLIDAAHGAGAGEKTIPNGDVSTGDIVPEIGITSTAVIDPSTNTIYVVAKSTVADTTFIQRLHALDITTGLEKFGGPVALSGSVAGNGNGSSGGVLNWDPKWENNRTSLLLLNGIVYIGFGSHGDNGPWHGWILAYNAATLQQTGVWCATPNAAAGGIWMGGTGLAADVPSGKPFGRMFTSTGNGTYDAAAPTYTNSMDYGDSILKLDLSNGVPTMNSSGTVVGDDFTPHDQASLNNGDTDQASGGVVILPDSVGGGSGQHQLVQLGKTGRIYVLNRENLGGYNPNNTKDPQESAYVGGLWGAPAYWNGNVYVWGTGDHLKAFSFANGVLSANPTSTSSESAGTYSPSPSVSSNGTSNGIVWSLKTDNYGSQGRAILYAHDASNVATLLYSSESNVGRDNPGNSVKFIVPTIINGKVYTGSEAQLNVFGLLNGATQAATPAINPASQSFNPSIQVSISDTTTGATIHYTTDGTTPTTASTTYNAPFTLTTTTTVNAIAAGTGLLQSPVASATYTLVTQVAIPSFTPAPGAYTTVQNVTISTTTANATIYYTTDGTTPTTASTKYTGPVSIGVTETLSAIAVASGLSNSPVASGLYTIDLGGVSSINFGSGFTAGGMALLGAAKLNGTSLRITDGGGNEAAAAWYNVPANIQSFTTDFTFLITAGSSPTADGMTFTMQANNASAIGPPGGGLGYGPDTTTGTPGIASSVAVKFDLYSNAGEGVNSTGLYTNGASPTTPFVDMTGSGIDLHAGHPIHAHMTYDGTNLVMTLTDTTTNGTFTHTWPINIPGTVGGNVAYVGFTGGTGGLTAIQDVQTWTFASTGTQSPAATPAFSEAGGTYLGTQTISLSDATSGASIFYTLDGTTPATAAGGSTLLYSTPITVTATKTIKAIAVANGFTPSAVASATYTIESQLAAPAFSPVAGTYPNSVTVSISAANGATIYYTTNGTAPTHSSAVYSGALTVTSSETIEAIAAVSGFFDSPVASAAYTIPPPAATPTFTPAPGTYTTSQSVTISDATPGTTIYYTTDNSTPTTGSAKYTGAISVSSTTTIKAMAASGSVSNSAVAAATYTISLPSTINYGAGFSTSGLTFNGSTKLNGTRLRLTDGGANEAASAWYATPVNVQTFSGDFTFQLTAPNGDGFTFVLQNTGTAALGPSGGGLGYGPDNVTNPSTSPNTPIAKSIAVKFDLYSNAGEGVNSTGLYLNGASPTTPAVTLGGGVNLHSGDILKAHLNYDGTTLTLTITDTVNTTQTFTTSWAVNIPSVVGGNTAYAGFTAGTGGSTATQEIITWTYNNSYTKNPGPPVVYATANLPAVSSGPTFRKFTYGGFPDTTGTILDATKVGDNVTFTVNVAAAGTYDVKLSYKKFTTRGISQLTINGTAVGANLDQYAATDSYATFDYGKFAFPAAGNYSFKFAVTGKNTGSSGYTVSFDDLTLTPQ